MSEWQTIETAPINTAVLVFVPNWDHYGPGIYRAIRVNFGPDRAAEHWHSSAWAMGRDFATDCQPTHWMPLPDPPSQPSGEAART